jgi:glycosyltransferase involved in cell wall biosynthesis
LLNIITPKLLQLLKQKIVYIISDINKAVLFEHTALGMRIKGFEVYFILINCLDTDFSRYLETHHFKTFHLSVSSIVTSWNKVIECQAILKKIQPNVVHCHMGTANWVGLWASYIQRLPRRIYTRHAGMPLELSFKEKVIDKIQNFIATDVVAISKVIQNLLLEQGVNASKIKVIRHGFDMQRMQQINTNEVERIQQLYNANRQHPVIGVIARWTQWKGIQYIIPAFKQLLTTHPNAKLCLFNADVNFDYSEQLLDLLHQLPSTSYVHVPFENNVYDLYQLFDIYVHTPINNNCEAFGQTYVEAMAAGIPSIFTLSGIGQEFIKHKCNAMVVDYKNSNQIHQAMLQLLNNAQLAQYIITQGKQDVADAFGLDAHYAQLSNLYLAQK